MPFTGSLIQKTYKYFMYTRKPIYLSSTTKAPLETHLSYDMNIYLIPRGKTTYSSREMEGVI